MAIARSVVAILALCMLAQPVKAAESPKCQTAEAHLTLDISISATGLAAHADVTGDLSGTYDLAVSLADLVPTSQPSVGLFTGTSVLNTRHGDTLNFIEAGAADFATGKLSVLWTIADGSTYKGKSASGQLFFIGNVRSTSPASSVGEGEIRGEVCTP